MTDSRENRGKDLLSTSKLLINQALNYVRWYWPIAPVLFLVNVIAWLTTGDLSVALTVVVAAWLATGYSALKELGTKKSVLSQLTAAAIFPYTLYKRGQYRVLITALKTFLLALLVSLVVAFVLTAPPVSSLTEDLQGVHDAFISLAGAAVMIWTVLIWLASESVSRRPEKVVQLVKRTLYLWVAASFISASLRHYGAQLQNLVDATLANPRTALLTVIVGVALVALVLLFRVLLNNVDPLFHPPSKIAEIARYGTHSSAIAYPEISPADRRVTSVHEAGHALLFAVAPDKLSEVQIKTRRFGDNQGSVTMVKDPDHLKTKEDFEWLMLMTLAGTAAEVSVFGQGYSGALGDTQAWQSVAKHYLETGFGEIYFVEPDSEYEVAHNLRVLASLRNTQERVLGAFMRNNVNVLNDLAVELLERNFMQQADVKPFLECVQVPDDFPRPQKPFETTT